MTIAVEIKPEVEAELVRQAALFGRRVEVYAASLIEGALHLPASAPPNAPARDMVELFAPLRGLSIDFERDRDTGRDIRL